MYTRVSAVSELNKLCCRLHLKMETRYVVLRIKVSQQKVIMFFSQVLSVVSDRE
jgi:hypothetical protein